MHRLFLFLGLLIWSVYAQDLSSSSSTNYVEIPQNDSVQEPLHMGRFVAVASLAGASYIGSYYLIFKNGWWSKESRNLHFENDFNYAQNIDKLGHFFAGVMLGEGFYDGFRWSGVSEFNSYLLAACMASTTHLGVEIKDGFAPSWGFSVFDVLSGTLGGFYPMAKRYVPFMRYVDFKYSYWNNSNVYWDYCKLNKIDDGGVFTDDYTNETFWLSFKVGRLLPKSFNKVWPQWLSLAGGVTVEPTLDGQGWWGHRDYLISLDYDFESIIKPKSYASSRVVSYLDLYKFPAPAIQVYPYRKYYLTYPIKF